MKPSSRRVVGLGFASCILAAGLTLVEGPEWSFVVGPVVALLVGLGLQRMLERVAEPRALLGMIRALPEATPSGHEGRLGDALELLQSAHSDALAKARDARLRAEHLAGEKDEFLRALRHDLRTPLNAILGFSEVLLSGIDGELNESQREDLEIVRSSGRHLVSLFDDVLDYGAQALSMSIGPTDARPILEEIAAELRGQSGGVRVVVEIEDDLPLVLADSKRLRQVVTNLTSNAAKFTDEGTITLRARTVGGEVEFAVHDTGCGIPERELEQVFAEFGQHRERGRSKRAREGTGLGLAIARRLVGLMGGTLTASSVVGEGSVFRVRLPSEPA